MARQKNQYHAEWRQGGIELSRHPGPTQYAHGADNCPTGRSCGGIRYLHGCRRNGAIRPSWPTPADLGDGMRGRGRRRGYKKSRPTGDEPGGRQHERRRHPTLPHCSAVPSAQPGLTSLFGMGRGGTPAQWPPVFSFAWPMAACVTHSTQESNLPAGTQRAPGKEPRVETFGQLVALGFGVAAFTPAPYQRRSLRRPSRSPNLADGFALRCFQRLS